MMTSRFFFRVIGILVIPLLFMVLFANFMMLGCTQPGADGSALILTSSEEDKNNVNGPYETGKNIVFEVRSMIPDHTITGYKWDVNVDDANAADFSTSFIPILDVNTHQISQVSSFNVNKYENCSFPRDNSGAEDQQERGRIIVCKAPATEGAFTVSVEIFSNDSSVIGRMKNSSQTYVTYINSSSPSAPSETKRDLADFDIGYYQSNASDFLQRTGNAFMTGDHLVLRNKSICIDCSDQSNCTSCRYDWVLENVDLPFTAGDKSINDTLHADTNFIAAIKSYLGRDFPSAGFDPVIPQRSTETAQATLRLFNQNGWEVGTKTVTFQISMPDLTQITPAAEAVVAPTAPAPIVVQTTLQGDFTIASIVGKEGRYPELTGDGTGNPAYIIELGYMTANDVNPQLQATVSGGQSPYSYQWQIGSGAFQAGATDGTFAHNRGFASVGDYQIMVRVTDAAGATFSFSKTLRIQNTGYRP